MAFEEKATAPIPSVGADEGQPISINTNQSIADASAKINDNLGFEEVARQIRQYNSPGYMRTFSSNHFFRETCLLCKIKMMNVRVIERAKIQCNDYRSRDDA